MRFTRDLETSAHRSANAEYAWRRPDALRAARAVTDSGFAILGGELWLVRGKKIYGVLPQVSGPPGVYHWTCERHEDESWSAFVARSYSETSAAINRFPREGEVDMPPGAEIYYNLTWVSEDGRD